MSPAGLETLVVLENARLVSSDGSRSWSLDVSAAGSRVTLIGDFTPLFGLLSGELTLQQGSARIGNADATRAVATGAVGLMRCDPPLPSAWAFERYLEESALLGGLGRRAARERVRETLRRFTLEALKSRLLASLSRPERRLLALANAVLLGPQVLVCERPLDRLESDGSERVATALEQAALGVSLVVSIAELAPLGPEKLLADRSDVLVVLESGIVTFTGAPSERIADLSLVSVIVSENWEAFATAVRAQGLAAEAQGFVDALHVLEPPHEGARFFRFIIELPAKAGSNCLFEAARAAHAPIVDLRSVVSRS